MEHGTFTPEGQVRFVGRDERRFSLTGEYTFPLPPDDDEYPFYELAIKVGGENDYGLPAHRIYLNFDPAQYAIPLSDKKVVLHQVLFARDTVSKQIVSEHGKLFVFLPSLCRGGDLVCKGQTISPSSTNMSWAIVEPNIFYTFQSVTYGVCCILEYNVFPAIDSRGPLSEDARLLMRRIMKDPNIVGSGRFFGFRFDDRRSDFDAMFRSMGYMPTFRRIVSLKREEEWAEDQFCDRCKMSGKGITNHHERDCIDMCFWCSVSMDGMRLISQLKLASTFYVIPETEATTKELSPVFSSCYEALNSTCLRLRRDVYWLGNPFDGKWTPAFTFRGYTFYEGSALFVYVAPPGNTQPIPSVELTREEMKEEDTARSVFMLY
jgi:hypothetical protein